ncbi:MAG: hypothetical protein ACTSYR_04170 [Candidatus Odinarchaeia archaeon]
MKINIKFNLNVDEFKRDINRIINNIPKVVSAMDVVGIALKHEVLNSSNWDTEYDLWNTGRFLAYLSRETPKAEKDGNAFRVGFGELENLNKITRPPETITVKTPSGRTRTIQTKGSNFPIWLMAEFGIRGLGKKPPSEFTTVRKVRKPGPMEYIGVRQDTGKPLFLMTPKGTKLHKGVKPTRLFRRGLRRVIEKNIIAKQLEEKIFGPKV